MTDNASYRLRAPDPTLTDLGAVEVTLEYQGDRPPLAHAIRSTRGSGTVCDVDHFHELAIEADWAAWFAVPCQECFPDAPPPGWRHAAHVPVGVDGLQLAADPHLAWQTER